MGPAPALAAGRCARRGSVSLPTPRAVQYRCVTHTGRGFCPGPLDRFHFLRTPTGEGALGSGGGGAQRAARGARVRATEGRGGEDGEGAAAAAAAAAARGARDGGAEQRPLARSLLRLCQRRALCTRGWGGLTLAWRPSLAVKSKRDGIHLPYSFLPRKIYQRVAKGFARKAPASQTRYHSQM